MKYTTSFINLHFNEVFGFLKLDGGLPPQMEEFWLSLLIILEQCNVQCKSSFYCAEIITSQGLPIQ